MARIHHPSYFRLTPDEEAALALWDETRMNVMEFCRALRISNSWMCTALHKRWEIAAFDTPPTPHPSSLSRARGNVRMDGTR